MRFETASHRSERVIRYALSWVHRDTGLKSANKPKFLSTKRQHRSTLNLHHIHIRTEPQKTWRSAGYAGCKVTSHAERLLGTFDVLSMEIFINDFSAPIKSLSRAQRGHQPYVLMRSSK